MYPGGYHVNDDLIMVSVFNCTTFKCAYRKNIPVVHVLLTPSSVVMLDTMMHVRSRDAGITVTSQYLQLALSFSKISVCNPVI